MKSNLTFVSLTYSVVLACGLLLGGHESWGQGQDCSNGQCLLTRSTADLAALPSTAASNVDAVNNLIASHVAGGDAGTTISNVLQSGDIPRQAVVDWMNDGLVDPLKGRIQANGSNLQDLVDAAEISQEKADAIAKALGKNSADDVTAEDIEDFEKKAEEEEKEKKKSKPGQTHADLQEDKDKKDDNKPNNGGCGPGGCKPGGGGGGLGGGGGGGGGLLAGLGQAAMQMLPQLLQGLMQGMLQNQGNQQGLENQVDQLTQEQLDQNFLNQFVFPTQTAIAQATAFAETATATAEETKEDEDNSTSNSEEETSEESEATPAPTPIPTPNPYQF